MAEPPSTAQSVGTFFAAYATATTVTVLPVLIVNPKRYDRPKWEMILKKAWAHSRRNFRLALLPVVLPIVYRTAHRFLTRRKEELEGSDASLPGNQHLRIVKKLYNVLPALLSSPLFILLPEGIRVQVALYFLSSFLYTFARLRARPQVKFEDDPHHETKDVKERRKQRSGKEMLENWRDYLPPVWTVSMLANTCLLWTFIFEPHAFPENYHDGFIEHCRRYLPISRTLEDVRRILNNTDHAKSIWSSPHEYIVCEVLHPTQVSCRKNFTSAFREEANRFAPWVAGATTVNMLFSGRFQLGKRGYVIVYFGLSFYAAFGRARIMSLRRGTLTLLCSFTTVIFDFINSTLRGTTYLTGSITTIWAISCVLQRILPVGKFSKSRWIINSSLSSMWILLLSRSRQVAISLFQFRLAAYSMWKVWKSRGGRSIKHGDLWLIAACWVGLIHYKDRTVGKRITGMIGQFMRMVDGTEFEEWVTERKRNEKGKGREDGQGNGGSSSVVRPPRPQSPKPYFPPKPTPGVYGPDAPGRGFSTPHYGTSTPSYSTPGPSGSARGLYGTPAPAPPPPPPPPSQPYPPPPSQSYQQPPSQSYKQPPSQAYQQPPPQPFHPPAPNAVQAPGQPSNFELYSKPFGGAGAPASHQEPDKIEPISKLGVSAMTSRFENTSTPPPRDMQEPIQVSRGGSAGSFSPVEAPQQPLFPMRVDPPSRATTAGDPFSDAKRVADDPHELSEVGSGSAADISASTASADGGNVLVHVDAPHGLGEEQHRDDDRDSIDSDDRMLMIDNNMTLAESPQSGISLLPRVEGEGAGMADSMGSSGLVHVEKP